MAVVVVNWNGLDDTRASVRSLLAQTWPHVDVHVVDNASANGEADALEREFGASIGLIRNATNRGFTGGNEPGMRVALDGGRARYVALLNNDAFAAPDWVEQLVRVAEAEPDAALFASLMVFDRAPDVTENAGITMLTTGDAIPRGRGRPRQDFAARADLLGACGGAVMYRATALRELGLFRDDFFANFEDVDLSLRMVAVAGHRCRFVPGAIVRHKLNATIGKVRDEAFRIRSIRNQTLAYWINMPKLVIALNLPALAISWLVAPLIALACGQRAFTRILWAGRRRALGEWRTIRAERRRLAPLRRARGLRVWWMQRSFVLAYLRFLFSDVLRRRRPPTD